MRRVECLAWVVTGWMGFGLCEFVMPNEMEERSAMVVVDLLWWLAVGFDGVMANACVWFTKVVCLSQ